jgi:hypothetical protein
MDGPLFKEEAMLQHITVYATLVILAMVVPSLAQTSEWPNRAPMPVIQSQQTQADEASRLGQSASGPTESRPSAIRPTEASLTEIVTWLSENFDLPPIYDHPRIEFVSPIQLVRMRYKGLLSDWSHVTIGGNDPAVQAAFRPEVVAVYNDTTKTILLTDGWTGKNPTELSVLVHEMVHHLQNLAKLKYECPGAREKPAYLAQDEWLKLHGHDLETEFQVDKFTIVANSACMH